AAQDKRVGAGPGSSAMHSGSLETATQPKPCGGPTDAGTPCSQEMPPSTGAPPAQFGEREGATYSMGGATFCWPPSAAPGGAAREHADEECRVATAATAATIFIARPRIEIASEARSEDRDRGAASDGNVRRPTDVSLSVRPGAG